MSQSTINHKEKLSYPSAANQLRKGNSKHSQVEAISMHEGSDHVQGGHETETKQRNSASVVHQHQGGNGPRADQSAKQGHSMSKESPLATQSSDQIAQATQTRILTSLELESVTDTTMLDGQKIDPGSFEKVPSPACGVSGNQNNLVIEHRNKLELEQNLQGSLAEVSPDARSSTSVAKIAQKTYNPEPESSPRTRNSQELVSFVGVGQDSCQQSNDKASVQRAASPSNVNRVHRSQNQELRHNQQPKKQRLNSHKNDLAGQVDPYETLKNVVKESDLNLKHEIKGSDGDACGSKANTANTEQAVGDGEHLEATVHGDNGCIMERGCDEAEQEPHNNEHDASRTNSNERVQSLESNSLTFAPNNSLQNQLNSPPYLASIKHNFQDRQRNQGLFLMNRNSLLLIDHETEQPEAEDMDIQQNQRHQREPGTSDLNLLSHQNSDHSDELSKIRDFERMDHHMSNYFDEGRMNNLQNEVSNISPIRPNNCARNADSVGPNKGLLGSSGTKEGFFDRSQSESNLSTPEVEPYSENNGLVKVFSVEKSQQQLNAQKEPISSSSLQEDIDILDSQDNIQLRQKIVSGNQPIDRADKNLEADFNIDKDKSRCQAMISNTASELKSLLNQEEYIPKNMTADQSFDLVDELEMNNIHKEQISSELHDLICQIIQNSQHMSDKYNSSSQQALPLNNQNLTEGNDQLQYNRIFEELEQRELYQLRACLGSESIQNSPTVDNLMVCQFNKQLEKAIKESNKALVSLKEMRQKNIKQIWSIYDDPIMEEEDCENSNKINQADRSSIKDLDVLSAGDGQDNVDNDTDQLPETDSVGQSNQNICSQEHNQNSNQMLDYWMRNEDQDNNSPVMSSQPTSENANAHQDDNKGKWTANESYNPNSKANNYDQNENGKVNKNNSSSGNNQSNDLANSVVGAANGSPQHKIIEFNWDNYENFRAKLYTLDQNGQWHDLGTGHFRIDYISYLQQYKMTLLQEQNRQIDLLKDEIIEPHIVFNRQRETIITWTDNNRDQDLAVSFSTDEGAEYTWQKIRQIPYLDQFESVDQNESDEPTILLSFENLQRLAEDLKNEYKLELDARQDILDLFLSNNNQNITKLGELFEECEARYIHYMQRQQQARDQQQTNYEEEIQYFFYIYKGLIQLNDAKMLEILMSEKYFLQTFGALEYDPDALEGQPDQIDQIEEIDPQAESNAVDQNDQIYEVQGIVEEEDGNSEESPQQSEGDGNNDEEYSEMKMEKYKLNLQAHGKMKSQNFGDQHSNGLQNNEFTLQFKLQSSNPQIFSTQRNDENYNSIKYVWDEQQQQDQGTSLAEEQPEEVMPCINDEDIERVDCQPKDEEKQCPNYILYNKRGDHKANYQEDNENQDLNDMEIVDLSCDKNNNVQQTASNDGQQEEIGDETQQNSNIREQNDQKLGDQGDQIYYNKEEPLLNNNVGRLVTQDNSENIVENENDEQRKKQSNYRLFNESQVIGRRTCKVQQSSQDTIDRANISSVNKPTNLMSEYLKIQNQPIELSHGQPVNEQTNINDLNQQSSLVDIPVEPDSSTAQNQISSEGNEKNNQTSYSKTYIKISSFIRSSDPSVTPLVQTESNINDDAVNDIQEPSGFLNTTNEAQNYSNCDKNVQQEEESLVNEITFTDRPSQIKKEEDQSIEVDDKNVYQSEQIQNDQQDDKVSQNVIMQIQNWVTDQDQENNEQIGQNQDEDVQYDYHDQDQEIPLDDINCGGAGEVAGQQEVIDQLCTQDEKVERQYLGRISLNYRDFLQYKVKFKKVVDFSQFYYNGQQQKQQDSLTQNDQSQGNRQTNDDQNNCSENANASQGSGSIDIEEKININYRLSYLKDSVMARYIDDTSLKVINQLITNNNREIISFIFGIPQGESDTYQSGPHGGKIRMMYPNGGGFNVFQNQQHGRGIGLNKDNQTVKDFIVELIKSKTNIQGRFQAIEFMIELCQVVKSLQFPPGMIGGANSFLYGQGGMGFNNRQVIDQLNQVNLIGLLAETLGMFVPTLESLEKHIQVRCEQDRQQLTNFYKGKYPDLDTAVIEQLLEINRSASSDDLIAANQGEKQVDEFERGTTRLDQMKINSLEIIIQFYQSAHLHMPDINKFALGIDQIQRGLPFLVQLVSHLKYSSENGIKVQICDFFKSLLDSDQIPFSQFQNKDSLYKNVMRRLVKFLKLFQEYDWNRFEGTQDEVAQKFELYRNLEHSAYLIMQILNKVTAEHRYPFKIFIVQQDVILIVANLTRIDSSLLNIEIVKFYKALIRSKDLGYIQMIIEQDLFIPVLQLFKQTYRPQNPPMIQSTIREIFEYIFRKNFGKISSTKNEFYNPKLIEHLTRHSQAAKDIIFDPKFAEIFDKYNLKPANHGLNAEARRRDGRHAGDSTDKDEYESQKTWDRIEMYSPVSIISRSDLGEDEFMVNQISSQPPFLNNDRFADLSGSHSEVWEENSNQFNLEGSKVSNIMLRQIGGDSNNKNMVSQYQMKQQQSLCPNQNNQSFESSLRQKLVQINQNQSNEGEEVDDDLEDIDEQPGYLRQQEYAQGDQKDEQPSCQQSYDSKVVSGSQPDGTQQKQLNNKSSLSKANQVFQEDQQENIIGKNVQNDSHLSNNDLQGNILYQNKEKDQPEPSSLAEDANGDEGGLSNQASESIIQYEQIREISSYERDAESIGMNNDRQQISEQNQQRQDINQPLRQDDNSDQVNLNNQTSLVNQTNEKKQVMQPYARSRLFGDSSAIKSKILFADKQFHRQHDVAIQQVTTTTNQGPQTTNSQGQAAQIPPCSEETAPEPPSSNSPPGLTSSQPETLQNSSLAELNEELKEKSEVTRGAEESQQTQKKEVIESRELGKSWKGSKMAVAIGAQVKDGKQELSTVQDRKGSGERQSVSAPSKQLSSAIEVQKSDNDSKSVQELSSPKSCGHLHSSTDNAKHSYEKDRPKSQFFGGGSAAQVASSSQASNKRQLQIQNKSSSSFEFSKLNNSSGSAKDHHAKVHGQSLSEFDKVSHNSSEHLIGLISEEDLTKDLGLFDIDILNTHKRQPSNSQNTKHQAGLKSSPIQHSSLAHKNSPPPDKSNLAQKQFNGSRLVGIKRKKSIDDALLTDVKDPFKEKLHDSGSIKKGSKSISGDLLEGDEVRVDEQIQFHSQDKLFQKSTLKTEQLFQPIKPHLNSNKNPIAPKLKTAITLQKDTVISGQKSNLKQNTAIPAKIQQNAPKKQYEISEQSQKNEQKVVNEGSGVLKSEQIQSQGSIEVVALSTQNIEKAQQSHDPNNEITSLLQEVEDRQNHANNEKILSQNSETRNMHSQSQSHNSQSHAISQSSSLKSPDKSTPQLQTIGQKRSIDSESGDICLSQQPMSSQQLQDGDLEQTDQETPTDNEQPASKDTTKRPSAKRQKHEDPNQQSQLRAAPDLSLTTKKLSTDSNNQSQNKT